MFDEATVPRHRRRFRLDHLLEAAAAFLFYGLFAILPVDAASALGGWIGRTVGPRLGVNRRVLGHLARALPDRPDAERRRIAKGVWENLGRTAAEYPHLTRLWNDPRRIERVGTERLRDLAAQGPVMLFSGHFANWELLPFAILGENPDAVMVYRRPNNRYVEGLLLRARPGGDRIVPKGRDGARAIVRALKAGGVVGLLVDQKLSTGGLPVPFFGRDAMTAPAVTRFAIRFDCPVVPLRIERLKGARFRVSYLPPIDWPRADDPEADTLAGLVVVNRTLEDWARERPEQWLWLHRRWGD